MTRLGLASFAEGNLGNQALLVRAGKWRLKAVRPAFKYGASDFRARHDEEIANGREFSGMGGAFALRKIKGGKLQSTTDRYQARRMNFAAIQPSGTNTAR